MPACVRPFFQHHDDQRADDGSRDAAAAAKQASATETMPASRAFLTMGTSANALPGSSTMPFTPRLIMFSIAATCVAESPATVELGAHRLQPVLLRLVDRCLFQLGEEGVRQLLFDNADPKLQLRRLT